MAGLRAKKVTLRGGFFFVWNSCMGCVRPCRVCLSACPSSLPSRIADPTPAPRPTRDGFGSVPLLGIYGQQANVDASTTDRIDPNELACARWAISASVTEARVLHEAEMLGRTPDWVTNRPRLVAIKKGPYVTAPVSCELHLAGQAVDLALIAAPAADLVARLVICLDTYLVAWLADAPGQASSQTRSTHFKSGSPAPHGADNQDRLGLTTPEAGTAAGRTAMIAIAANRHAPPAAYKAGV